MTQPDSGEREATRWVYCSDPACSERRLHLAHQPATVVPVMISQDLAQRILAALEEIPHMAVTMANCDRLRALADELRARIPTADPRKE